ncbi:MAG: hypothetical protein GF383_16680 [Candidatus Lokiarchaeota archaeon]|nr:hypothetical protein [Candidatus Lokiarchaeota archaeon]
MTTFEVPQDLARRLLPFQDHLPEIIELGLEHWRSQEQEPAHLTPRQRVENLWAAHGLTTSLHPATIQRYAEPSKRQPPLRTEGKPASQIIIDQRKGQ